ncbi:glycosyltransferase [Microbacterium gallinarum]|uniref:D-inositol 3-phosphate glycosyltransferase n=1 Tax=Microbacterium gallinarum TaxID=2762209 RepID=A0ABR8WYS8_9MICO|nr:glycosyltransferase [Microbacterium gallinarum]MBD8022240.1 glycosyltransferase [Microbacterium gallinarum]
MTRLLLFTNDYPYATGDAVFVDKEIRYLAAAFDDVAVFCYARDTSAGVVDMPANVFLADNLFERAPDDSLFAPLRPQMIAALARAAGQEMRAGRLRRHLRLFLMGARVGITGARRRAVRDAISEDPDCVAYAFWGMGGGLALAWLRGVRARVLRLHRYDLYEERSPEGYLPFRRFLLSRADRVLAISDDGADYLRRTYGSAVRPGAIRVSRLGVWGPDVVVRPGSERARTVVSCSAVTEVKRVELIYEAVRAVPGLSPENPIRWIHFGDGDLFGELVARIADPPPGLEVELRGQVPNRDVAAFYERHRVDAFVNLSSSEGVPVSIMEAIAYGIPVVATAVGGTPEIVSHDQRSGELVAVDADASTIGGVLRAVIDAPDGTYDPRAVWRERYDARVTGPAAADLVRGALDDHAHLNSKETP